MNYRTLGRTGLSVSEIGFGAWGIGGRTVAETSYGDTDDATSRSALLRAFDSGITFFDTSAAYGNGHSETLIGEALARVRKDVVIATKAGYDSWDRPPDFSAAAIVASTERSLRRLGSDYVDLLLLHNAPLEVLVADDVRKAMAGLVASGKVRAWGLSAKGPADALAALQASDVPVIQANFNMMDVRAVTSGLFAEVSRRQAGFIARTPLCFGFLSGTVTRDTRFPPGDHRLSWSAAQLANWIDGARDLLAAVSAAPGAEGVHAALRFCLAFTEVSTTIPGILTSDEAVQNAAASQRGPLPQKAVAAVLEINRNRQFFVAAAKSS
ncbi:MAG: aldo/keto reductase [Reyranella sp.]|nr:aldo/keto reductase [Reyranella sp.]MBL6654032.1 aldo/keto reductase [Reyranella sp.]